MKRFASILIAATIFSCSVGTSSHLTSDFPLSNEKAYSKTSNIYVNPPNGWLVAEDNECNCTELWIIKDDYSASITFRKINLDKETLNELAGNETEKVADYSKIFIRAKLGKKFDKFFGEESFQLEGKTFSAYRYVNDKDQTIRVVIFKHYDKFFESEACSNGNNDLNELFRIQNSVLSTLN